VHYGRDKQAAQETVGLIEKDGGRVFAVGAELGAPGAVDQLFDQLEAGLLVEAVGGEGFVAGPLGAGEVGLEILALEATACVAAAELLERGITPAAGGCENVDQVTGRSAVGRATAAGARLHGCRRGRGQS
jgi:hypothetical protein